nr:unnamed protein product [Digitaria exilis]
MASVALTVLLVNPNLYRAAINCHSLWVCAVAGLFSLMGAYTAGSSSNGRHNEAKPPIDAADGTSKGTSLSGSNEGGGTSSSSENTGCDDIIEPHTERRYLVLVAILAARVTYQAGLVPPGGFWPDNKDGHAAGHPVLHDSNHRRYYIFYCNSTSFATSIAVIALLILELIHMENKDDGQCTLLIHVAHYMMLLDLVGLLGAYASGSSREWETSGYIVAVVAAVLFYIAIYNTLPSRKKMWPASL